MAVRLGRKRSPLPRLLLCHPVEFPLRPPCAEVSGGVASIKNFPWYKHVSVGAVGVGVFLLLYHHDLIPHVVVYEAYPGVGSNRLSPPVDLNWA